jgi:hypothetical protein
MVYMLLHDEYIAVSFKNLNDETPCTQIDVTRENLDYEVNFLHFNSNGEDHDPFSSTLRG